MQKTRAKVKTKHKGPAITITKKRKNNGKKEKFSAKGQRRGVFFGTKRCLESGKVNFPETAPSTWPQKTD